MRRDGWVSVIVGYKLVKGVLWLVLAVVIAALIRGGAGERLLGLASHLRHPAHAWSLMFAHLVVRAASGRGLWTLVVALVADGFVSLVEGWALLRGRWWGPWIVVGATGILLPFEVVAFVQHPHAIRACVFCLNLAIVWYLARRALAER